MSSKSPRKEKKAKKGIQVRIDADLSARAERVFRAIGIDTPTAIRIFFSKVAVTGGIPFDMRDDSYYVYTPEQLKEIDEAYQESLDPKNVRGPFDTVEEMITDMDRQPL